MAQLFPVAKKLWVGPYLVLQDSNLSHGLVSPAVLHPHFLYSRFFFYFTKYCLKFLTNQQGKSYYIFLIITIILMLFKVIFYYLSSYLFSSAVCYLLIFFNVLVFRSELAYFCGASILKINNFIIIIIWRTLVSAVMNLRVPWNAGNFLTSCKPVSFSRRTLHHGVSIIIIIIIIIKLTLLELGFICRRPWIFMLVGWKAV